MEQAQRLRRAQRSHGELYSMTNKKTGFSLIEVMLVLAFVFVLFVAMMMTVHVSINRQRYEDGLTSFRDFLQRQYTEVQNVVMDRGVSSHIKKCDSDDVRGGNRGRTDCYVIGRLLTFYEEGGATAVKVEQVAYRTRGVTSSKTELEYNDFYIGESGITNSIETFGTEVDTYFLEWAVRLYTPKPEPRLIRDNLSIFIFRSPETGNVRTYINSTEKVAASDLSSKILADENLFGQVVLCVIPDGEAYSTLRAVKVSAGTANASGIEIVTREQAREADCAKP